MALHSNDIKQIMWALTQEIMAAPTLKLGGKGEIALNLAGKSPNLDALKALQRHLQSMCQVVGEELNLSTRELYYPARVELLKEFGDTASPLRFRRKTTGGQKKVSAKAMAKVWLLSGAVEDFWASYRVTTSKNTVLLANLAQVFPESSMNPNLWLRNFAVIDGEICYMAGGVQSEAKLDQGTLSQAELLATGPPKVSWGGSAGCTTTFGGSEGGFAENSTLLVEVPPHSGSSAYVAPYEITSVPTLNLRSEAFGGSVGSPNRVGGASGTVRGGVEQRNTNALQKNTTALLQNTSASIAPLENTSASSSNTFLKASGGQVVAATPLEKVSGANYEVRTTTASCKTQSASCRRANYPSTNAPYQNTSASSTIFAIPFRNAPGGSEIAATPLGGTCGVISGVQNTTASSKTPNASVRNTSACIGDKSASCASSVSSGQNQSASALSQMQLVKSVLSQEEEGKESVFDAETAEEAVVSPMEALVPESAVDCAMECRRLADAKRMQLRVLTSEIELLERKALDIMIEAYMASRAKLNND